MKAKAAEEVGITFKHVAIPAEAEVDEVVEIVKKLNDDQSISGILVQLPLGDHVGADGERTVTEAVSPEKDVDGSVRRTVCYGVTDAVRIDSTPTTSDTCLLARPTPSLPRVLPRELSSFWSLLVFPLQALMRSFLDAVTSLAAPLRRCSETAMPLSRSVTVVRRTYLTL